MPAGREVTLNFGPEVSRFVWAASTGTAKDTQGTGMARELAVFGTRGDGKTWGALGSMIAHAVNHQKAGYPLPTRWAGVTDTFASHEAKTHDSLMAPGWGGLWALEDAGHVAVCRLEGRELVRLRLFGIEDQGAYNRLRMECHGLWFEEPAPALAVSAGIVEDAWTLGMTSQRLPSHYRPAILTTNYPDEEHWTWERFVERRHPGTAYFRIPPGERADPADREEWARALSANPALRRRLLDGEPGIVILGAQVAEGFRRATHVQDRVTPEPDATVWIGQDGGLTPTSVIGQRIGPWRRILGAVTSEHDGIKQHVQGLLRPWLSEHVPWCLRSTEALQILYDPAMDVAGQGDTTANPLHIMRRELPGIYRPAPVDYPTRLQPMYDVFNVGAQGLPALQIDRGQCRGLIRALEGGWHYPTAPDGRTRRDLPVKSHPDSDYGDALCYLLWGMSPSRPEGVRGRKPVIRTHFNPLDHGRPVQRQSYRVRL